MKSGSSRPLRRSCSFPVPIRATIGGWGWVWRWSARTSGSWAGRWRSNPSPPPEPVLQCALPKTPALDLTAVARGQFHISRNVYPRLRLDYDGDGPCASIQTSRSHAISPRKQFGSGKSHVICELQRLQLSSPEAIRLVREMWEILRRKKGCTLNRLYRSLQEDQRWLAYSEWTSLAELAGARREAARSPLNRRLHS